MKKARPVKTFTFEYRGGEVRYNRLDGYSAYLHGQLVGCADSYSEAEALIDEARMRQVGIE